jgi:hypothetical protein
VALPTCQEMDDAYQMGAISNIDSKNPYRWNTALWMQWNTGRIDNARCYVLRSKNRLRTVGRYMLIGAVAGMVVSLALYYTR